MPYEKKAKTPKNQSQTKNRQNKKSLFSFLTSNFSFIFFLFSLFSLLFCSCDIWQTPFSTFVAEATGEAEGEALEFLTARFVKAENTSIPAEEETIIRIDINNEHNYNLELTVQGTGKEKAAVTLNSDRKSAIVTITNPSRLEEFHLTLEMTNNGRPMPSYTLPPMEALYFNKDLTTLTLTSNHNNTPGSFDQIFDPQITEYTIYVPYETTSVNITASVPDQENEVYSSFAIFDTQIAGKDYEIKEGEIEIQMSAATLTVPITVTADCGDTKTYTLNIIKGPSPYAYITKFAIEADGVTFESKIDQSAKTITVTLPHGTPLTNITPIVEIEGASYTPATPQNFTTPVTYTVTAPLGNTVTYTVTVTLAAVLSIEITTPPAETVFFVGDPEPDFAELGLIVTAHFSNGNSAPITGYTTTGFDTTAAGEKTITVTYDGKTDFFTITVNPTHVTISVDLQFSNFENEVPIINTGVTIYRVTGATTAKIEITNHTDYEKITWYFEGVELETGSSITLNSSDTRYNLLGTKELTVIVEKNGAPYNAKVIFTVEF